MDARSEASAIGARFDSSGCSAGRLRWVGVSTTLWIERKLPANFWMVGECVWMLGMAGKRLEG